MQAIEPGPRGAAAPTGYAPVVLLLSGVRFFPMSPNTSRVQAIEPGPRGAAATGYVPVVPLLGYFLSAPSDQGAYLSTDESLDSIWMVYKWVVWDVLGPMCEAPSSSANLCSAGTHLIHAPQHSQQQVLSHIGILQSVWCRISLTPCRMLCVQRLVMLILNCQSVTFLCRWEGLRPLGMLMMEGPPQPMYGLLKSK